MTTVPTLRALSKTALAPWQRVWRDGLAPQLSPRALEILVRALADDDERLIQRAVSEPPPLDCCADWLITKADPLALTLWLANGLTTVGEVEQAWAWVCAACDRRLGAPLCGEFLAWWDETPRSEARLALLREVNRVLRLAA